MKKMSRIAIVLISIFMLLAMIPTAVSMAVGAKPNVTMTVDKTTVEPGDKIIVELANPAMNFQGLSLKLKYDPELVECTAMLNGDGGDENLYMNCINSEGKEKAMTTMVSDSIEDMGDGQFSFAMMPGEDTDFVEGTIVTFTFVALQEGEVTFILEEHCVGEDAYKGEISHKVTIAPPAPACEHENTTTTCTPAANKQHTVTVTCDACGETVGTPTTENCTGTDDNDCTTAVECQHCEQTIIEAKTHVDGDDKNHACDNAGCTVDNVDGGHTPAADDGNCETAIHCTECDAVTTEAKTHVDGDDKNHACDNAGCTVDNVDGGHTPAADDGDCTTAIHCTECDAVTTEAKTHVDGDDKNHACDNDGCTVDNVDGGHTPAADDGDCTTAIHCTECDAVTTEAKTHVDGDDKNHACDNEGCTVDNVSDCSDKDDDGDHNCDVCGKPDVTDHAGNYYFNWSWDEDNLSWEIYLGFYCPECDTNNDAAEVYDEPELVTTPTCTVNGVYAYSFDFSNVTLPAGWVWENFELSSTIPKGAVWNAETKILTYEMTWKTDPDNHTGKLVYTNNGGTHSAVYDCCNAPYVTNEDHDYTTGNSAHTCICGDVNKYTLTVYDMPAAVGDADPKEFTVPYGTNILEFINGKVDLNNVDMNNDLVKGYHFWLDYWMDYNNWITVDEDSIVSGNIEITAVSSFHGWQRMSTDDPWSYQDMGAFVTGWHEVDGEWYYFFMNEAIWWNYPVTGMTRVPYPTEKINGVTYEPDAVSDIFIDAYEAWFIFDENGKFQSAKTGMVDHNGTTRYAVNGMIPWHYGFATDGSDYYYFIGDAENGGNMLATGDVYMTRPNGLTINGKTVYEKGVYTFGADGKLCLYNGVTKVGDALRYYYDYCYTAKRGLIAVEVEGATKYVYVKSSTANLVANAQYYIPAGNAYDIVSGMYTFDENGYMIDVEHTDKNGIFFEDGAYYYYEEGVRAYAGLIQYTGTASDGTVYTNAWIYVRNDGQLATGKYWITKTNGEMESKPYMFNEYGMMDGRNGIVAENGSLYYYVDGVLAKGTGLIKIGDNYYYVRSTGEVVNNRNYWISNTNEYDVIAKIYAFDENGVMLDVETKDTSLNGVVDGYYYVDGQIQYGAGPIVWEGDVYYVRTNGQVATGNYWTTVANDVLPSGKYEFDETGKLIKE